MSTTMPRAFGTIIATPAYPPHRPKDAGRAIFIVTAVALVSLMLLAATARATTSPSPVDGQLAFNNACRTCHSVDAGDNRLGPSLHDIVGRKAASEDGYAYSSALKSSGITWTRDQLDAFIADPSAVVPGHNMKPYSGVGEADLRAKIIAYLAEAG